MSTEPGQLEQSLLDPTRLSIMSVLAASRWAEFGFVRDSVGLTDSALSKQATTLGRLNFVEMNKGYVGNRPRSWLRITSNGRAALASHITALQQIAHNATVIGTDHEPSDGPPG